MNCSHPPIPPARAPIPDPSGLAAVLGIARSGALSLVLHPLWSTTAVACLVAVLAPLLVAIGLARGVSDSARASLAAGADLTVSCMRFGRPSPLPAGAAEIVRGVPGVQSVERRVTGALTLGVRHEAVVVVGVEDERLRADGASDLCSEGRLPAAPFEAALGSVLAERLGVRAGASIPPFYRNRSGERITRVTGVLRADAPIAQANVLLVPLATAQAYFDEEGAVTSLLVRCAPEYVGAVRAAILRIPTLGPPGEPALRPLVVSREDAEARLARATVLREGGFLSWLGLSLVTAAPVLLVATGLGLSERRRETGLLRALGWRTDEIVLRSLFESLALAVAGWSLAVLAAWVWVRIFSGAGIAALVVPDAGLVPGIVLPCRLAPEALFASAAAAVAVVSTGTIVTAWRSSAASPAEAMR